MSHIETHSEHAPPLFVQLSPIVVDTEVIAVCAMPIFIRGRNSNSVATLASFRQEGLRTKVVQKTILVSEMKLDNTEVLRSQLGSIRTAIIGPVSTQMGTESGIGAKREALSWITQSAAKSGEDGNELETAFRSFPAPNPNPIHTPVLFFPPRRGGERV